MIIRLYRRLFGGGTPPIYIPERINFEVIAKQGLDIPYPWMERHGGEVVESWVDHYREQRVFLWKV